LSGPSSALSQELWHKIFLKQNNALSFYFISVFCFVSIPKGAAAAANSQRERGENDGTDFSG
jgi:hypothetical protein